MNILFGISNCDEHLDTIAPIAESLRRRHTDVVCDVVSFCEFVGLETDVQTLRTVFDNVHILNYTAGKKMPFLQNLVYRLNLLPETLRKVWNVRTELCDIIRKTNPRVTILSNDRRFPQYDLGFLANRFHIPTLLLQESIRKDLAMQSHDSGKNGQVLRRVFNYQTGQLRYGEGGCTRVAAWGQNGVDYFQTVGVPNDSIFVAGNPRIDNFVDRCHRLSRSAARGNLGIALEARVILFATNPLSWMGIASLSDYLEAIRTVINLVDRLGGEGFDCLLLLKPHQFERADHRLYGIVQACEISRFARYLEDTSLDASIAATDSVLVFNSTVAIEAALMEKPVGIVNLHEWELGIDFVERGLAVKLDDEFLVEGFLRGDRGVERRQVINVQHYVQYIGSSADRISEEIIRMATSCT